MVLSVPRVALRYRGAYPQRARAGELAYPAVVSFGRLGPDPWIEVANNISFGNLFRQNDEDYVELLTIEP